MSKISLKIPNVSSVHWNELADARTRLAFKVERYGFLQITREPRIVEKNESFVNYKEVNFTQF